jgi:anti-repressor protein
MLLGQNGKKNIINNSFSVQGEDWVYTGDTISQQLNLELSNPLSQDFALSIDFAKRLSMMARTEAGEKVRQYFIEIEKQYLAIVSTPPIFRTSLS